MEKVENRTNNPRVMALKALHEIYVKDAYANIVLQDYVAKCKFNDQDRRFFTELVYGVLRQQNYIDAVIRYFTNKKINQLATWVLLILRLGFYQLMFLDKIPSNAATNESVKLAKKFTNRLAPFVNAVLRNYLRQKDNIKIDLLAKNEIEKLSLEYNQPIWLIELLKEQYSLEKTIKLLEYFNLKPQLTARLNTLKGNINDLKNVLIESGIEFQTSSYFEDGIIITKHDGNLKQASWVKNGLLSFMDIGSMAIAKLLNPMPGDMVLDVCAAPGGKTCHMAALMQNQGKIMANDIHRHKLELIKNNCQRLGVNIVETKLSDATEFSSDELECYDKILVDAPCSGLGVLQKKLDMRFRRKLADLEEFANLQLKILKAAAPKLKKGGYMVYSTCTLNKEENENVVNKFLLEHTDFKVVQPDVPFRNDNGCITLMPDETYTDGFFMVKLQKVTGV